MRDLGLVAAVIAAFVFIFTGLFEGGLSGIFPPLSLRPPHLPLQAFLVFSYFPKRPGKKKKVKLSDCY